MADLAQGNFANVVLKAGDSLRVSTAGQATVLAEYGAPAGTTTINANSQTFGPYQVPAKLRVTAVAGTANYAQPTQVPVTVDQSTNTVNPPGAVSGGGISGLDNEKLSQLFGDDQMLIGTFANRPLASTVASGKEFAASDLGYCRWVSDGTQWILLKPGNLLNMATPSTITDSAGQATTESTLLTLNIPAGALGANDGLELDLLWSCTNTAAAKRLRARFGGTVLFNVDLTTHLVFRQSVKLRNRNSQSAQVSQGNSVTNFGPIGSVGAQTFTADFSVAQALTITGQFPVTGSSANTLTLEEATIRAI